jgi:hypothetical protein
MPDRHDDLIAELRALGDHLDIPAPADQRAAVRARLTSRRRWRYWIIGAVAAIAAGTGAIAPARAAVVAAVMRVAGIEVHVAQPPVTGSLPASPLPSVRSAALESARRAALFPVRVPAELGAPEQVLLADVLPSGAPRVVTLTYRGGAVRFDQFDGTLSLILLKQAPNAEWVQIGGETGLWLSDPHPVTYVGRDGVERTATARLAGPTLIWSAGQVTYRLEGLATREEALKVARSVG